MWLVYILELADGSYYTGITNNLEKRLKIHASGKGSKYVKARLPIKSVIYTEEVENRSIASKREIEIKKLSHEQKGKLNEIS
jgi:predicted GIY-YIG superfamily endonuclease